MQHSHSSKSFRLVPIIFVALLAVGSMVCPAVRGDMKPEQLNARADVVKARRYVETAEEMLTRNALASSKLLDIASQLAPDDPEVRMAVNNFKLIENPNRNPLYDEQLELVESSKNAPMLYYRVLMENVPPSMDTDSLSRFKMAMRGYRRFSKTDYFIGMVFERARQYILSKRYKLDDKTSQPVDTFDLSPRDMDFVRRMWAFADSIERADGFSDIVDTYRLQTYHYMGMDDELEKLQTALLQRDSTDVSLVNEMMTLAYVRNDHEKLSKLALLKFRNNPEPDEVYSVYSVLANDTLRGQMIDVVIATANDKDNDIDLRLKLLRALTAAYYRTLDEKDDSVTVTKTPELDRIDLTVTQLVNEDPDEDVPHIVATILGGNKSWLENYGYKHWLRAIDMIPGKVNELLALGQLVVRDVSNNDEIADGIAKLDKIVQKSNPELDLDIKQALAQYYYNSKKFDEAVKVLKPITIDDVRRSIELKKMAGYEADTVDVAVNEDGIPDVAKIEAVDTVALNPNLVAEVVEADPDEVLKEWSAIQTVLYQSQMMLKQPDDAFATMRALLKLQPDDAELLNNLAYYMCEEDRNLDEALKLVDKSLSITSDNHNAIDTRAWILYKKGDAKAALDEMEKLFALYDIDMYQELLTKEEPRAMLEIFTGHLENVFTFMALIPIYEHFLLIAEKVDYDKYEKALWCMIEILKNYSVLSEQSNDDVVPAFESRHERPASFPELIDYFNADKK